MGRLIFYIGLLAVPLIILGLLVTPLRIPKGEPGLSSGHVTGEGVELAAAAPAISLNCTLPRPTWSTHIHVLRLLYGGKETPVQESPYNDGSQVDVFVTDPERPVILVLVGGRPIVWNIRVHPKSRVMGIIVAGESSQIVVGAGGPSAASLVQSGHKCYELLQRYFPAQGYSYEEAALRRFIDATLGQPITSYQDARSEDEIWVGPELDLPESKFDDMPFVVPSDLVDNHRPILFGRAALKRLVKEGVIRPAAKEDLDRWIAYGVKAPGIHADLSDLDLDRTYVVNRFFRLPLSLMGNASSAFIVPPGVTRPEGDAGESMVLTYQPYGCMWSGGFFGNCASMSPP